MADSWLTDGDCERCRREKYCGNPCKAHRVRTKLAFYDLMMHETLKTMPGLAEHMDKAAYACGMLE